VDLEQKVISYKELADQIKALEEQKETLSKEILELMPKELKTIRLSSFQVRRIGRLSIKTSLEVARTFDAIKTEEVVDKEKIKSLILEGHFVPDVSEIEYIQVSRSSPK